MKKPTVSAKAAAYAATLARREQTVSAVATIDNAGDVLVTTFYASPGSVRMTCERFKPLDGETPVVALGKVVGENPDLAGGAARSAELYTLATRAATGRDPPLPKVRT